MSTFEQFAFQTPLYVKLPLPKDMLLKAILRNVRDVKLDGHCPYCGQNSTFSYWQRNDWSLDPLSANLETIQESVGYRTLEITCARDDSHTINFWYRLEKNAVVKVGQEPSLADIANDEAATYRSVLKKEDAAELHKAIGLAAHGVGVGSFVYLRRIFENIIFNRFSEFRDAEGWVEGDFKKLRMNEKVQFLQGHIPNFLYENREMYSVLSQGIHSLSEEDCLRAFEPLKLSIKIVLEEDKKKQEEQALKEAAAAAIKAFNPGG